MGKDTLGKKHNQLPTYVMMNRSYIVENYRQLMDFEKIKTYWKQCPTMYSLGLLS
jgi:hypothetical protein